MHGLIRNCPVQSEIFDIHDPPSVMVRVTLKWDVWGWQIKNANIGIESWVPVISTEFECGGLWDDESTQPRQQKYHCTWWCRKERDQNNLCHNSPYLAATIVMMPIEIANYSAGTTYAFHTKIWFQQVMQNITEMQLQKGWMQVFSNYYVAKQNKSRSSFA